MAPAPAVSHARPFRSIRAGVALLVAAATAVAGVTLVEPAAPAQAAGSVDQRNDVIGTSSYYSMWGGSGITQEFVAGASGSVDAVDVYLGFLYGPSPESIAVTVAIEVAGVRGPAATITPTPSAWNHVALPSVAPIAAGTVGRIVVRSVGASSSGITVPTNSSYAPASSLHPAAFDISFRTYLDTSLVAPTISGDPSTGTYWAGLAEPSFSYVASGSPAPTFSATGAVPPGMRVTPSGQLQGVPTTVGTYAFRVAATNGVGPGVSVSSIITVRDPRASAPTGLVVGPSPRGGLELRWSAPADQGAAPVGDYLVMVGDSPFVSETTSMEVSELLLPIGVAVPITVAARSSVGEGHVGTTTYTRTTVPDAPTALTAVASGAGAIALAWAAPQQAGGTPVTSYEVLHRPAGGGELSWSRPSTLTFPTATTAVVAGLVPGTSYELMVAATNAVGSGGWSASATALAIGAPTAPDAPQVTLADGALDIRWSAPQTLATPVTSTVVEVRAPGGAFAPVATVADASGSVRVEGLVNGATYEVRVLATNAAGTTASAVVQAVPRTVPGALTLSAALDGPGAVRLQWTGGGDGGSPVTQLVVERRVAGGGWQPLLDMGPAATSLRVAQQAGVEVEYRISARNAAGLGPASASAAITAILRAPAPTSLQAVGAPWAVELRWVSAASAAAPVDAWRVEQLVPGGSWQPADAVVVGTTAVVTGLAPSVGYRFRVLGVNALGVGLGGTAVSAAAFTTPGAPTNVVATPADRSVSVAWTAPADGGSTITRYVVERLVDGAWVEASGVEAGAATATVGGLANGESVELRVVAVNSAGAGAPSASVVATPRTAPDAPGALEATPASNAVELTWQAPVVDGGADVTGYVVEQRRGDGEWMPAAVEIDGTTAVVSNLANGTAYDLRVAAVNAAGVGAWVQVAVTPRRAPDAPTAVEASPGSERIALTWEAPTFDGGSPVVDWVLQVHRWGDRDETGEPIWVEPASTTFDGASAVVGGLVDGAMYSVRVAARNAAGQGAWSEPTSAMPRSLPSAPIGLTAFPSSGQVQLTWSPPIDDGGVGVESWVLQVRAPGGAWMVPERTEGAQNLVTVLGLADGTAYEFRVAAVTIAGQGAWSETVSATPTGIATAVVDLRATPGDGRVLLAWDAPEWDGGTPILDYVVLQTEPSGAFTIAQAQIDGTTAVVAGLTNGTSVAFAVLARTANGVGAMGEPVSTTPFVFAPTLIAPGGGSLEGSTLRAGDAVTVQASGLPAGAEAVVELHSTPIELGRVTVDAAGELSLQVTIPAGVAPGAHEIVVRLLDAGVDVAPVRIPVSIAAPIVTPPVVAPAPIAAAPAPSAAAGGAGQLPRTGSETLLPMLLLALALLGAGAAMRRGGAVRRRAAMPVRR